MLGALNLEPVNIYSTPSAWKYIIVIFKAWKTVGYGTVIYLAAIMGIDKSLNQAAEIDGANIFQRVWYITIPGILPTVTIFIIKNIISNRGYDYPRHEMRQ